MRKSKGNSGKICGKSAKQLMKILVCRKYKKWRCSKLFNDFLHVDIMHVDISRAGHVSVLWIRTHFFRIRIRIRIHKFFFSDSDTDSDS
jgi:hypothetical protein